jgi:hypothetical protein
MLADQQHVAKQGSRTRSHRIEKATGMVQQGSANCWSASTMAKQTTDPTIRSDRQERKQTPLPPWPGNHLHGRGIVHYQESTMKSGRNQHTKLDNGSIFLEWRAWPTQAGPLLAEFILSRIYHTLAHGDRNSQCAQLVLQSGTQRLTDAYSKQSRNDRTNLVSGSWSAPVSET